MPPRVAFISGPLDPSDDYLEKYYIPSIKAAIGNGDSFVIGPVFGIDRLALDYLLAQGVAPTRITIHMAEFEYAMKPFRESFEKRGVKIHTFGQTTRQRDSSMTEASDYDILRYRTESECKTLYGTYWRPRVSNTEMNERRRKGIVSEAYIAHEEKRDPNV